MAWLRRSLLGAVALLLPTGTTTTASCPTGPWLSQGQLDVTHAACGAVGDGGTDDSGAVERCLRIAANCSVPLFFPPGMYYLPSTVVVAKERGVPSSVSLMGSRAIAAPGAYEVGAGAASILCKCAHCSCDATSPRGPVLQFGSCLSALGSGGYNLESLDIVGNELGLLVECAAALSMERVRVRAGQYDGSSMSAAMIAVNSYELYFWGCLFTFVVHDLHPGTCNYTASTACVGVPSVILRGANASSFGPTAPAGILYSYMVAFEKTLFQYGGVQYQQLTDLPEARVVWLRFTTCFSESSSTPLLDFVSAPWVRPGFFGVEGVTISDYSNWDEMSRGPILQLNSSVVVLDALTVQASSGGTGHPVRAT